MLSLQTPNDCGQSVPFPVAAVTNDHRFVGQGQFSWAEMKV